ncbi:putative short-chain dehydrogenase [Pavlovales sp. CCMP2436]|nr:putative short-chain dehydrogenase [Pavlovales sp. CCMP2436]
MLTAVLAAMVASSAPRTFLVTGSTDGIGRFTATQLAKAGHTVLVHGRSAEKVARVVTEVRACGAASVDGFVADLSLCSEVRRLGSEVLARHPVLDGLLNNAGTFDGDYTGSRVVTAEGNEYSLAVNVAAPFLLTSLLLPALRKSAHARVLFTSSMSQGSAGVLDDPQMEKGWEGHSAYSFSKLANAMLAVEMHARYADPPRLTVNTMDPGTVDTKMLRAGWWSGGSSVETATASYWLLTDPRLAETSGKYFVEHGQSRASATVNDADKRRRLWEYLAELTGAAWTPPRA